MIKRPNHPSDPQLQAAADEIKEIMKRYDCMGVFVLASGNGHSEYLNCIDHMSWSAICIEDNKRIRVRAYVRTAPTGKRVFERIKLQKTVNAVFHFRDVLAMLWNGYNGLSDKLKEHVDVEEGPSKFTPR